MQPDVVIFSPQYPHVSRARGLTGSIQHPSETQPVGISDGIAAGRLVLVALEPDAVPTTDVVAEDRLIVVVVDNAFETVTVSVRPNTAKLNEVLVGITVGLELEVIKLLGGLEAVAAIFPDELDMVGTDWTPEPATGETFFVYTDNFAASPQIWVELPAQGMPHLAKPIRSAGGALVPQ
jgi:hypothetical protein